MQASVNVENVTLELALIVVCIIGYTCSAEAVSCWWGGFSYEACCDTSFGPFGNPTCWDTTFSFEICCRSESKDEFFIELDPDHESMLFDTLDEEAIERLASIIGPRKLVEPLIATLKAREAQSAAQWWQSQVSMLAAVERNVDPRLDQSLKQLPLISFPLLLEALVPEHRRNRFALNIGGGDGKNHDPVFHLFKAYDYGGVVVEAERSLQAELLFNLGPYNESGDIHIHLEHLRPRVVPLLIKMYRVPHDLDVLKIDIDSCDVDIMKAFLESGLRPKFVAVEVNPDIPPPFQWHFEIDRRFYKDSANLAWKGLYGGSADSFFHLLSKSYGYALVAFEFIDARHRCPLCEHNMWFAHGDLVGKVAPSWSGMVRLFWSQIALLNTQCLHLQLTFSCPLQDLDLLTLVAGASRLPQAEQSIVLSLPEHREMALAYAHQMQQAIQKECAHVTCGSYGFGTPCLRSACPSFTDVTTSLTTSQSQLQSSKINGSDPLRISAGATLVKCGYFTHRQVARFLGETESNVLIALDGLSSSSRSSTRQSKLQQLAAAC